MISHNRTHFLSMYIDQCLNYTSAVMDGLKATSSDARLCVCISQYTGMYVSVDVGV